MLNGARCRVQRTDRPPRDLLAARIGRPGFWWRTLVTRLGGLELRVPQDRDGRFFRCENWLEASRCLPMDDMRKQKKLALPRLHHRPILPFAER
jgi:hypothetical protein